MGTVAEALYRDSTFGDLQDLPHVGSTLEHPLVFDCTARELKGMAQRGMVEIVSEHRRHTGQEWLIDALQFRKIG